MSFICIAWRFVVLTSPTAKNLPSLLIDRHVAALILSRLVQVFEVGESFHSCLEGFGVKGEYPTDESLTDVKVRFFESLAVLVGVEGVHEGKFDGMTGTAAGRARKNR